MPVEVPETVVSSTMNRRGGARRAYTRRKTSELSLEEFWDNRIREQEATTRRIIRHHRTPEEKEKARLDGLGFVERLRKFKADAIAARDAELLRRE